MNRKNIAKELRSQRMKYIDEMARVKPLKLMPNLDLVTINMVAEYFETDPGAISNYFTTHKKELEEYGIIKLRAENFENAGYTISDGNRGFKIATYDGMEVRIGHTGLRCMSMTAVFNMALGLMCSDVAEQIREAVKKVEIESGENIAIIENNKDEINETVEEIVKTANDILTFTNCEFGNVRVIEDDGRILFSGTDSAKALGYNNPRDAIHKHCRYVVKRDVPHPQNNDKRITMMFIPESDLYRLVFRSNLDTADKFTDWITEEVLPSIRKNGGYIAEQEELTEAELMAKAIMVAQKTIEEREKRIAELSVTNKALSDKVNTWEPKSVINALIRAYAACCFNNNFAFAFNDYYKQLNYKHHINVKSRRTNSNDSKELPLIEYIRENEMDNAVKLAVAICEACGINTGKVINEVNLSMCGC